jgi:predicted nucleic acid-binding protein
MSSRILILDANILIRAVLGNKVRDYLLKYSGNIDFVTPDVCMADAQKYLPILFEKRLLPPEPALKLLSSFECLLQVVDEGAYKTHADDARQRIQSRDIQDWPIVATALALNAPIWTEDQVFFGSGLPTWTTDRIHIFLESV